MSYHRPREMDRTPLATGFLRPRQVDLLDCRILGEFFAGDTFFWKTSEASRVEAAAKLNLHRNTIRTRINRLTVDGVLLPAEIGLSSEAMGLAIGRVFFPLPSEQRSHTLIEALFHIEGLSPVMVYENGWSVTVRADDADSLGQKLRQVELIIGRRTAGWEAHDPPHQPDYSKLSRTDVELLSHLVCKSEQPPNQVSAELGVSPRTVFRRVARLRREGFLSLRPSRGADLIGPALGYFDLELSGNNTDHIDRLAIERAGCLFRHTSERALHLFLFASTFPELEELRLSFSTLKGVAKASLRRFFGFHPNPQLSKWMLRKLQREWKLYSH